MDWWRWWWLARLLLRWTCWFDMNNIGKLRRLDFLALAIFVLFCTNFSVCFTFLKWNFLLLRYPFCFDKNWNRHGTANHKINTNSSRLPLSDLAARDLAAASTSIFDTGSSSTAKRIGKRLPPSFTDGVERENWTEPNPNNPQARRIRTNTNCTHRRSTTSNNNRVCYFFFFFLPFCYKHTTTILLPTTTRVTHCWPVKEGRKLKNRFPLRFNSRCFDFFDSSSFFHFLWNVFFFRFLWDCGTKRFQEIENCLFVCLRVKKDREES